MNERFTVTVEARPQDGPIEARLRLWLKLGQRRFGLRCVEAKEVAQAEKPTPPTPPTPPTEEPRQ